MKNSKFLARQALVAAIYTGLSLLLAPISFSGAQIRVSEALTILPVFGPSYIIGVTLGCFLTNLIGFFMGVNILGSVDVIFGTLATFSAAILTYSLRKIKFESLPVLAVIPPIIINAVVIGAELSFLIAGSFNFLVFIPQAALVGFGQLLSCFGLGLFLVNIISKNKTLLEIFSEN